MNSKLREQGKKEEKRRLKEFVENAYRCDPRVIAHKEAQRAERCSSYPRVLQVCRVLHQDIEAQRSNLLSTYWPSLCSVHALSHVSSP